MTPQSSDRSQPALTLHEHWPIDALAARGWNVYMSVTQKQPETPMIAVFATIDMVLGLYTWIIIASAIFSWLYAFNVVNSNNRFVGMIGEFLYKATEPALRPIRRIMPDLGGLDISPIVLLIAIFFLRTFIATSIAPIFL